MSGKTYFGGQEGANLYSIDLSYLPGTIPASGIVDLGRTNWTHTLQVADGLLFVNSAEAAWAAGSSTRRRIRPIHRCLRKVGAVQTVTATTALLATIFSTRPTAIAPAGGSWTSQESAAEAPPRCWERRP